MSSGSYLHKIINLFNLLYNNETLLTTCVLLRYFTAIKYKRNKNQKEIENLFTFLKKMVIFTIEFKILLYMRISFSNVSLI